MEYKFTNEKKSNFVRTHFLYPNQPEHYKVDIDFFNQILIDNVKIQNCIDEMSSNESRIHSVLLLCDYFEKNPMRVYEKFQIGDVVTFFRYITLCDTQKPVLRSICFFIQFIKDNVQFKELIQRLDFYSHINTLIDNPTDDETQQLAICCALYSLDLGFDVRKCLFDNHIYDTLMKKKTNTDFSEYLRGKFFKSAAKYCDELGNAFEDSFIKFLIKSILNSIPRKKKPNDEYYSYYDHYDYGNQLSSKIFVAESIAALESTFSKSYFGVQLIEANQILPLFIDFLFDKKEPKLRRNAAKIIYTLFDSMQVSNQDIRELQIVKSFFLTAALNDHVLFTLCMRIYRYIIDNSESFDLSIVIDQIVELDFSECFLNASFEIKLEMLSKIQFIVFNSTTDQITKLFSPQNIEFFCDLISSDNFGVCVDVVYIFLLALDRKTNVEFLNMMNSIMVDSGAFEQLINQMNDPDNPQTDTNYIYKLVNMLQPSI